MNIIYIGYDIEGVGGISTYSRYQIKALKDLGLNTIVYSLNQQKEAVFSGYVDKHIIYNPLRTKAFILTIADILLYHRDMDLIMINHVNLSLIGLFLKKILKKKYSVNIYNNEILLNLSYLKKVGFSGADRAISDCKHTINNLSNFYSIIPKCELLYDPVDINFFSIKPKEYAKQSISEKFKIEALMNKFVLITVACMRQSQNKGHRLVIEALTKLANPNILYLIVGEGVDKKNIEKYAKKCGVAHQIRFLGFVDEDIMPDLYNSADVAVLISRSEYGLGEGVPLGLLEAAACGLPVICGNEDGSIEIINHQVDMPNGFAVNPRKVSEVVHKIETYNNNRELLKQHGENSRKYIKSLFCYQSFVKRQKDILKGMLNAA